MANCRLSESQDIDRGFLRVVLLTQDDPFYLGPNINYLLHNLPAKVDIVGCVLFDVSPFGRRESLQKKALRTINIFGFSFFVRYGLRYIKSCLFRRYRVQTVLSDHGISLMKVDGSINDPVAQARIKEKNPDLLVSIAGNQIFGRELIKLAPKGCINLHTALLPKYRGLMPSFWVLCNDEERTGVSVFFVDEGIDSGPILVQREVEIAGKSLEEVIVLTKRLGMECIIEALERISNDNVVLFENNDDEMTYYSFPDKNDVTKFLAMGKRFY